MSSRERYHKRMCQQIQETRLQISKRKKNEESTEDDNDKKNKKTDSLDKDTRKNKTRFIII